jgi:RND family efflux transporter MFP subunit
VIVVSEVEGQQIKIVEMLRDGTAVKKGDIVMRFDAAEIERAQAVQEIKVMQAEALSKTAQEELRIQQNKAESEVAKAMLALTLTELDKKKYLEGDYGVELDTLKGSIALAEADLNEAQDTAEYYGKLVKKGFRTPEQLRAKELAVMKARYNLERDRKKLDVLEQFARERQTVELTAKAAEAKRELARAESSRDAAVSKANTDFEATQVTARLERSVLEKLQKQLDRCTVQAPQDGIVVYFKDKTNRVELGATVYFKQKLFSLPDLSKLQVKTFVHESLLKKVAPGLKAEIRVDAYPGVVLHGTVTDVATFFDSSRQWLSGGAKEYQTLVLVNDVPRVGLKPGMTAAVKILVSQAPSVLVVPLHAVSETGGEYYCYVVTSSGVDRRRVSIGESNDYFIEIKEGLSENEHVALNARTRAAAEAKRNGHGLSKPVAPDPTPSDLVAVSQG